MPRLVLIVEVDADPARMDPHDIGEALVDGYEQDLLRGAAGPTVTFASAEWEG